MDHMSQHEVYSDLADKQSCFSLKRWTCDTLKTPRARFTLNTTFHSLSIVLSSFLLICYFRCLLSLFLFFPLGRTETSHTLNMLKISQLLWGLGSDGLKAFQSQVPWSSLTVSLYAYFRRVQASWKIHHPQISASKSAGEASSQPKRLHALKGWNIYELGEGELHKGCWCAF